MFSLRGKEAPGSEMELSSVLKEIESLKTKPNAKWNKGRDPTLLSFQLVKVIKKSLSSERDHGNQKADRYIIEERGQVPASASRRT